MDFFSHLTADVQALHVACGGGEITADALLGVIASLDDEAVVRLIAQASAVVQAGERLRIVAAGVAAARSSRGAGHSGLAQVRGHRTPVSLVQELTGSTRADAAKHVRLGEAMLETMPEFRADDRVDGVDDRSDGADDGSERPVEPWHAGLTRALLAGSVTSAQHDAILRGLGEPPEVESADSQTEFREVWVLASEQLMEEAGVRTTEELAREARSIRDLLDPEGAARRYQDRFDGRAFRRWTDQNGVRHASVAFEDEGGAWVETIFDAALRPRRGGPRFVDPDEQASAQALVDDPRTDDQLAYDLLIDVLRAGALAEPEAVFGTRQAGVRLVVTDASLADAAAGRAAVALIEDDQCAIPAWIAERHACTTGIVPVVVDGFGRPLDVGRRQRLFTSRQRVALAIRDGGCRWRGCDRPASYCEAHHIHAFAEGGRTDVDRGILLCRFHHMNLHHGGWRIARGGAGEFLLHPPNGGDPVILPPRLALRYAWGDIAPPTPRFRPVAA